jgi:ArsR family transcriptional regulator
MNFFKAISNSKRLKIIQLLKIGAKCSCELEWSLKLSQPTISHHLRILENSNIIKITQKGKWKLISLNETPIIFWLLEQIDK